MTGQSNEDDRRDPEGLTGILEAIEHAIASARAMPMSSSVLVNRAELLDLVAQAHDILPTQLTQADDVLAAADSARAAAAAEAVRCRLVGDCTGSASGRAAGGMRCEAPQNPARAPESKQEQQEQRQQSSRSRREAATGAVSEPKPPISRVVRPCSFPTKDHARHLQPNSYKLA